MRRPQIDQLLPSTYQRTAEPGSVLGALLDVMEHLHAPDEVVLDAVDEYLDPWRCPDAFVPFLARWVDLDWLLPADAPAERPVAFAPGYGRLRTLVAHGAQLAQWRGTSAGLRWFLELATGVSGYAVDEVGHGRPFHVLVLAPAAAEPHLDLVRRIVAGEKPAFVTAEVQLMPAPTADDPDEPTGASGE
jgi:phage tail-like protein